MVLFAHAPLPRPDGNHALSGQADFAQRLRGTLMFRRLDLDGRQARKAVADALGQRRSWFAPKRGPSALLVQSQRNVAARNPNVLDLIGLEDISTRLGVCETPPSLREVVVP